jgi:hypothetical protein
LFGPGQAPKGPEKTEIFFREIKKSQTILDFGKALKGPGNLKFSLKN